MTPSPAWIGSATAGDVVAPQADRRLAAVGGDLDTLARGDRARDQRIARARDHQLGDVDRGGKAARTPSGHAGGADEEDCRLREVVRERIEERVENFARRGRLVDGSSAAPVRSSASSRSWRRASASTLARLEACLARFASWTALSSDSASSFARCVSRRPRDCFIRAWSSCVRSSSSWCRRDAKV